MSARKLWVRIRGLPPDSATVHAAQAEDGPQEAAQQGQPQQPGKVRYLEDIPVARSLREAGRFLNANADEFSQMAQQAG